MKLQDIIKGRIRNQLRIHWDWMRSDKRNMDSDEVSDFIDSWINQSIKAYEAQSQQEVMDK